MAIKKIKLPDNTERDINDARVVSDAITYIGTAAGTATYVDGGQIIDVTTKADKVVGATNGNFASLDSTGNLADSGHKHSDYQEKLVSGTNIKTINNTSLLGSGDITISGGGSDLPPVNSSDYGKFLTVDYNSTNGYFWNKSAALVIESMLVSTMYNYDFLVWGSLGNTRISTSGITKYSFSDWSWLKINYAAGGTTVTKTLEDALGAKYELPSGGIPKTSLASAVQTSLGKADTALQSYTETDPTVPSWAKSSSKPTYTASEVGALPTSGGTMTGDITMTNGKYIKSGSGSRIIGVDSSGDLYIGGEDVRDFHDITFYNDGELKHSTSGSLDTILTTGNYKSTYLLRPITISTSEPTSSQGSDGDIWMVI